MATKSKNGLAAQRKAAKKASQKTLKQLGPFTPFVQESDPPAGTYDPGLDSELSAAGRGLEDLGADTEKARQRALDDYTIGQGDIERQRGEGIADVRRSQGRYMENQATNEQREMFDYNQSISGLRRQYARLARGQAEQQRMAGTEGGAQAAAAQARAENYDINRIPIDEAHQRFVQDDQRARARFDEDTTTQEQRFTQGLDRASGQNTLSYQRGVTDSGDTLSRAQRENQFFGQDIGRAKWFQASQSGYQPATKPAGEYGSGQNAYRFVRLADGRLVKQYASGKQEIRPAKKRDLINGKTGARR